MDRAHKTSSQEFRDSLRGYFDKNPRGKPAPRSRRLAAPEDLFDDDLPPMTRESARFPPVSPEHFEQLERMLDTEGLPKILRTLRELCDARRPHDGAAFESFEPVAADVEAEQNADELETLLLRLARRVQA